MPMRLMRRCVLYANFESCFGDFGTLQLIPGTAYIPEITVPTTWKVVAPTTKEIWPILFQLSVDPWSKHILCEHVFTKTSGWVQSNIPPNIKNVAFMVLQLCWILYKMVLFKNYRWCHADFITMKIFVIWVWLRNYQCCKFQLNPSILRGKVLHRKISAMKRKKNVKMKKIWTKTKAVPHFVE